MLRSSDHPVSSHYITGYICEDICTRHKADNAVPHINVRHLRCPWHASLAMLGILNQEAYPTMAYIPVRLNFPNAGPTSGKVLHEPSLWAMLAGKDEAILLKLSMQILNTSIPTCRNQNETRSTQQIVKTMALSFRDRVSVSKKGLHNSETGVFWP